MERHYYKVILPKGFARELKKDFELFLRSPSTGLDSETMRKEIASKLNIPETKVSIATKEKFEEVASVNVLPPKQLTLF